MSSRANFKSSVRSWENKIILCDVFSMVISSISTETQVSLIICIGSTFLHYIVYHNLFIVTGVPKFVE